MIIKMTDNNHLVICTTGGTILSVLPNLQSEDIVKTVCLAAIGASVSFCVSVVLKIIFRKRKK